MKEKTMEEKTIVRLTELSREYPRGGGCFFAVKGVSLEVKAGDYVNIIGRSGSEKGKSITARRR